MARIINGTLYVSTFDATATPGEYTVTNATWNNQADPEGAGTSVITPGFILYVPAASTATGDPIPGVAHRYRLTAVTAVDTSLINATILWDDFGPEADTPLNSTFCILSEATTSQHLGLPASDLVYSSLSPGSSTGALATDFRRVLDATEPAIAVGAATQYWRGDKVWTSFATDTRGTDLTGLNTAAGGIVLASDTILAAFGKLEYRMAINDAKTGGIPAVTPDRVIISDGAGAPIASGTSNTTLSYLDVGSSVTTLLSGKEASITAGTSAQYWRGDKVWTSFATDTRGTVLTGLNTATGGNVIATDSILAAFGKLENRMVINDAKAGFTPVTANRVLVSDVSGNPAASSTNTTTLSYLDVGSSLTTLLAGKEASITAGTSAQYWRGDKVWTNFATDTRGTVLTGLSTATGGTVVAADTVLVAFGKLENRMAINDAKTGFTPVTANRVLISDVSGNPIASATTTTTLGYLDVGSSLTTLLAGKETSISAGTSAQYWRGDKTWQTLNATAVGAEPSITAGAATQYWRGDKTWQNLETPVRGTVLTGLSTATGGTVAATDSILAAFGKLENRMAINDAKTSAGTLTASTGITRSTNDFQLTPVTANRVLVSNASGILSASSTSTTTLGYLDIGSSLTTLLAGKEASITAGTTAQYWRGDKTWQNLETPVRGTVLTGLSATTGGTILDTDSILTAFGRTENRLATLEGASSAGIMTVYNVVSRYEVDPAAGQAVWVTSAATEYRNIPWTRTLTSLTLTHASHGRTAGQRVILRGINVDYLNTLITSVGANTITVAVADSGNTTGNGAYSMGFTFNHVGPGPGSYASGVLIAPSNGNVVLLSMRIHLGASVRASTTYDITIPPSAVNGGGSNSTDDNIYVPIYSVRQDVNALSAVGATISKAVGGDYSKFQFAALPATTTGIYIMLSF